MKFLPSLFMICLIMFTSAASELWFITSDQLELNVSISSELSVTKEDSSSTLREATATLSLFPMPSARQTIHYQEAKGTQNDFENNTFVFHWYNRTAEHLPFSLYTRLRTYSWLPEIKEKIPFPIQNLSDEARVYLAATKKVNWNDDAIIALASSLVEGNDDLYIVVHTLATWINTNLTYDLRYAATIEDAQYVLGKRAGTCDEFTTLFLALTRAVGIPSRYVSGVAYSNIPQLQGFGPHAWAEVYFPHYGWVPFDTLYNEFGYLDASHVELQKSLDSAKSSTHYSWSGYRVSVEGGRLEIEADVVRNGTALEPLVVLNASLLKSEVGFGSYNLVTVVIQNQKPYYVPVELYLSRTQELTFFTEPTHSLLLRPKEEKAVYWLVKVDEDLEKHFMYTFQIQARTMRNATSTGHFLATGSGPVFNRENIQTIMDQKREELGKVYSKNVELMCDPLKKTIYLEQGTDVRCTLVNTGNSYLQQLPICLDEECQTINLGIAQKKDVVFPVTFGTEGKRELTITAINEQISKVAYVALEVLEPPSLSIVNLTYPENASYSDTFQVSFLIQLDGYADAQHVRVVLTSKRGPKEWELENLSGSKRFIINQRGVELSEGPNPFNLTITYEDLEGRHYQSSSSFIIELNEVPTIQRMTFLLNDLGTTLRPYDILFVVIIVFGVGILAGYLFNKRRIRY